MSPDALDEARAAVGRWIPLDASTAYPNARLRRLASKATAVIAAFSAGRPAA